MGIPFYTRLSPTWIIITPEMENEIACEAMEFKFHTELYIRQRIKKTSDGLGRNSDINDEGGFIIILPCLSYHHHHYLPPLHDTYRL